MRERRLTCDSSATPWVTRTPRCRSQPELFEEMGKFIEEATKAGVLVATGGVVRSTKVKVSYDGTEFTVIDGPFTEAKELIGGWALMECRDKDEAVEWTRRFLAIAGEGECRSGRFLRPRSRGGPAERVA